MTPGSQEARCAGCKCPQIDNHYGEGEPRRDGTRRFTYHSDCPVHGIHANPDEWKASQ